MKINNFFLSLYAATSRITINVIGNLVFSEILVLISLPFINIKKLLIKHKALKIVIAGFTLLLIIQIISDYVNNSEPNDYLRGWAIMIFSMASTIYLVYNLSKNQNGIIYYLMLLFLVNLIFGQGALDVGLFEEDTNYFKTRFVIFLNPALLIISYYLFTKNKKYLFGFLFLFIVITFIILVILNMFLL